MSDLIAFFVVAAILLLAITPFIVHNHLLMAAIREDLISKIENEGGHDINIVQMHRLGDTRNCQIELTFRNQANDLCRHKVICKFFPLFFDWNFYWDQPIGNASKPSNSSKLTSKEEIITEMQSRIDSLEAQIHGLKAQPRSLGRDDSIPQ